MVADRGRRRDNFGGREGSSRRAERVRSTRNVSIRFNTNLRSGDLVSLARC